MFARDPWELQQMSEQLSDGIINLISAKIIKKQDSVDLEVNDFKV